MYLFVGFLVWSYHLTVYRWMVNVASQRWLLWLNSFGYGWQVLEGLEDTPTASRFNLGRGIPRSPRMGFWINRDTLPRNIKEPKIKMFYLGNRGPRVTSISLDCLPAELGYLALLEQLGWCATGDQWAVRSRGVLQGHRQLQLHRGGTSFGRSHCLYRCYDLLLTLRQVDHNIYFYLLIIFISELVVSTLGLSMIMMPKHI